MFMLKCPNCKLPITNDADIKKKRATCVCKQQGKCVSIMNKLLSDVWGQLYAN